MSVIEGSNDEVTHVRNMPDVQLKEFIRQRNEALTKLRERHWQPIDTAPQDGTEIIGTNGVDVFMCVFNDPHCYGVWAYSYDSGAVEVEPVPTHWMPVPELPK